ncbi:hypothetical protein PGT21_021961 [Puccinia graminis f. sp. tritici]|uniref:Uncharacterized protein n=1 Tax=Puccinia graminis f. sp. tritici TaxID=56615 RepID=A0A5B0QWA0_PUCGR|nr:hypothetical protein PGT21_021961 [Puccinia graminis f. sp. tritici]KAA1117183.1 hypothetical protein PGTUg99_036828 [Puccinia graminis f. sp. tritici]
MMMLRNPGLISFICLIHSIQAITRARVPRSLAFAGGAKSGGHLLLLPRKISDSNSHPQVLQEIHNLAGCGGEICGTLAGDAVQPLLAGADECAQQDMADKMIDIAKSKLQDKAVQKKLIELAKTYRQTERNTFPDYSSPSTPDRNSLYCQKKPKNPELVGLSQKQSSAADPKLFFDPKSNGKSIQKGSDPRTEPLGAAKGQTTPVNSTASTKEDTDDPDVDEDDVPEDGSDEAAGNASDNSANASSPGPNAFSSSTTRSPTQVQHDRELGIVESSRPHKLADSTQSSQAPTSVRPQAPSTDPVKNSATKEKSQPPQGKRKSSGKCRPKRLRRV